MPKCGELQIWRILRLEPQIWVKSRSSSSPARSSSRRYTRICALPFAACASDPHSLIEPGPSGMPPRTGWKDLPLRTGHRPCENTVLLAEVAEVWTHLNPQDSANIARRAGVKRLALTNSDASIPPLAFPAQLLLIVGGYPKSSLNFSGSHSAHFFHRAAWHAGSLPVTNL